MPFSTSPATISFLFSPFPLSDADASLSSPLPLSRLLLLPTAGALFPFCQRVSSVQENRKERSSRQREQWEGSFLLKKVSFLHCTDSIFKHGSTKQYTEEKRASLSFPFPPHIPPISFCKSDLVERAPNTKGAWEEGGGMRGERGASEQHQ